MSSYLDGIPAAALAFDRDGNPILDQYGEQEFCLDHHKGECSGAVEFRYPLSGTGRSFVRCDHHWDLRLNEQDRINRTYGVSSPPEGYDYYDAGERWDEDY